MRLTTFWNDEHGVVTVDWTVLSAAALGMALAAGGIMNLTREDLSDQIDAEFAGEAENSTWDEASGEPIIIAWDDFTNGAGGWEGGRSAYVEGFGDILGRMTGADGNEQVRSTFELQDGYEYAVMTFDFIALDSWDRETFSIFIDGQEMATQNVWWRGDNDGSGDFQFDAEGGGLFASVEAFDRANIGGNNRYSDQVFRITMVVRDPGNTITIGFGSDTNAGRNNESWGLDNFSLVQTNDHAGADAFFD